MYIRIKINERRFWNTSNGLWSCLIIKNIYERVHGREFSIESLKKDYGVIKKAKEEGKSLRRFVDPILNPYDQFRMLVGSVPRADAFIKGGG